MWLPTGLFTKTTPLHNSRGHLYLAPSATAIINLSWGNVCHMEQRTRNKHGMGIYGGINRQKLHHTISFFSLTYVVHFFLLNFFFYPHPSFKYPYFHFLPLRYVHHTLANSANLTYEFSNILRYFNFSNTMDRAEMREIAIKHSNMCNTGV